MAYNDNENPQKRFNKLDLRVFRLLWEYKKVLLDHLEKYSKTMEIDNSIIVLQQDIENRTHNVFLLAMDCNITNNTKYLEKVLYYIEELKEIEKDYFLYIMDYCIQYQIKEFITSVIIYF